MLLKYYYLEKGKLRMANNFQLFGEDEAGGGLLAALEVTLEARDNHVVAGVAEVVVDAIDGPLVCLSDFVVADVDREPAVVAD